MKKKKLGRLNFWDIGLIKLTSFAFALLLVSFFSGFAQWVQSVNPVYFLLAVIVFAAKPVYTYLSK